MRHVKEWESRWAGHWDKAIAGCSALKAALVRAMRCEAASANELMCAESLVDMEQFYDNISPLCLLRLGRELRYPLRVLALETQLNVAPRMLVVGSACSAPQWVANSTLPGTRCANSLARVYLHKVIEGVIAANPWSTVEQFVDDVVIQTVGSTVQETVERQMEATEGFMQGVTELRCRVSTKSQVLGSNAKLKQALGQAVAARGLPLKFVDQAVDLGCDTTAGRKRWMPKRKKAVRHC
jgi:hypothetical protein